MKSVFKEMITKYRWIFLLYFLISGIIFLKIFLSNGAIIGSDWSFPDNISQLKVLFSSQFHSWTMTGNFFGSRQLSPASNIVIGPIYLLSLIGVPVALLIKLFLVGIFGLAAANINLFLRYLKLKPLSAFIGGLVFIMSPVFFNYSLIGWIYVLLSLALLPLFVYLFLLAIDQHNYKYILFAAAVFSIAAIQSQTVVWYPLVIFTVVVGYGLKSNNFWLSFKYAILLMVVFLLLNFYWLPGLLLFPDQGIIGSDMVKSSISLGTSQRLSTYNLLRAWGSLYNYQFETSYVKILTVFSFVVPLIAFGCFFFLKKFKKHISYLLMIFLVPAVFYFAGRQIISHLPFANAIRDVARFSTLSTFALSAMFAITFDQIYISSKKYKYWYLLFIGIALFVNTYPFWSGNLFSQPTSGYDFRMRTKLWPGEYQQLNDKLSKEDLSKRALFLPLGGLVSLTDDLRFNGSYHELSDIYSGYSPVAGTVFFSDRSSGASSEIITAINESIKNQDIDQLEYLSSLAKINFIVFRRDMDFYDWDKDQKMDFERKLNDLVGSGKAEIYLDKGPIFALKFQSNKGIIDTESQLVEIDSNNGKILSDYLGINYMGSSQFNQIDNYREVSSLFPGRNLFTYNEQNLILSSFDQSTPSGNMFVSLEQIRGAMLLRKWNYLQQNLNPKLDSGIKGENEKAILAIDSSLLTDDVRGRYVVYLNEPNIISTTYFKSQSQNLTDVKINGKNYQAKPIGSGLLAIESLELLKGLNIFQIDNKNIIPLLVKAKNLSADLTIPKITPRKVNASEYSIKIENARGDFYLSFAENFNGYWRITKTGRLLDKELVSANDHFVSNGFGNGYKIKLSDLEKAGAVSKNSDGTFSGEVRLIFWPEKTILPGIVVTSLSMAVILYLLFTKRKEKSNGK